MAPNLGKRENFESYFEHKSEEPQSYFILELSSRQ